MLWTELGDSINAFQYNGYLKILVYGEYGTADYYVGSGITNESVVTVIFYSGSLWILFNWAKNCYMNHFSSIEEATRLLSAY